MEDFGIFRVAERALRWRLLGFGKESGQGIVEAALDGRNRWLFVHNAGGESFVGLSECLQGGENVGISGRRLAGAEFGNSERNGRKKLRVQAHQIGSEADIEQRCVRRKRARMVFLVAVRGEKIGAIGRAIERDFAFRAAADGADFFSFGRAKAFGLAFLTNWTGQWFSPALESDY